MPGNRSVGTLLNAVPGLVVNDGALAASPTMTFFAARGGPINEGRMAINGMTIAAPFNGGGVSTYILDSINVDEVSVAVGGGLGETDIGGPVMNLVPRSGGNSFRGSAFINNAGDWSRGNNLNDELTARRRDRITRPPASSTPTTRACRTAARSSAIDSGSLAAIAAWRRRRRCQASSTTRMRSMPRGGTGWEIRASRCGRCRDARPTSGGSRRRSPPNIASPTTRSTSAAARGRR